MNSSTATENIKYGKQVPVMVIEMSRPEKRNALSVVMYNGLMEALTEAEHDPKVRCMLITGAGGNFTSGNDVLDFMNAPPVDDSSPVFQFLLKLVELKKPLVAAVTGAAVGIGTTMLLHCDLAYAGEGAKFQMPFVNLGLCPEAGSSYLLPMMMGHLRASELLLLGGRFDAHKAREYGIVNEVVSDDALFDHALAQATRVAEQPAASVRLSKMLLKQRQSAAVHKAITDEGAEFATRLTSPEAAEAFTSFLEKRKPDFSKWD